MDGNVVPCLAEIGRTGQSVRIGSNLIRLRQKMENCPIGIDPLQHLPREAEHSEQVLGLSVSEEVPVNTPRRGAGRRAPKTEEIHGQRGVNASSSSIT